MDPHDTVLASRRLRATGIIVALILGFLLGTQFGAIDPDFLLLPLFVSLWFPVVIVVGGPWESLPRRLLAFAAATLLSAFLTFESARLSFWLTSRSASRAIAEVVAAGRSGRVHEYLGTVSPERHETQAFISAARAGAVPSGIDESGCYYFGVSLPGGPSCELVGSRRALFRGWELEVTSCRDEAPNSALQPPGAPGT